MPRQPLNKRRDKNQTHKTSPVEHLSDADVAFLSQKATFKTDKARRDLGYLPQISLEEEMRLTEAWLRERGYV